MAIWHSAITHFEGNPITALRLRFAFPMLDPATGLVAWHSATDPAKTRLWPVDAPAAGELDRAVLRDDAVGERPVYRLSDTIVQ